MTLSIRPERLHLLADAPEATPCTVLGQIYLGTDLQYQVSLADGTRLTVRAPNSAGQRQRFAAGQRAGLQFEKGSASVLLD
ncbi:TOBE domain protein [compost metagenome]